MTDIISQFFEASEIDSEFTLAEVIKAAKDIYGIDIRDQYCLHTGKAISRIYDSELEFGLSEETGDSIDELADAMMVRVIASMRPSPALNKPDTLTLANLCSKRPVDAMAYFVNRLEGSRDLLTKRESGLSFGPLLQRIQTYNKWRELYDDGVDLTPWLHWLCELDAKMNLHDLRVPTLALDRRNQLFLTNVGTSLFSFVTLENHSELLSLFEKWVFRQLGVYEDRDRLATATANWTRGNRFSVVALTRSWIDNPVIARRSTDARIKHTTSLANLKATKTAAAKAAKPSNPKTAERKAKMANAMALLDSLSSKPIETPAPAPAPVPAKVPVSGVFSRLGIKIVGKS